MSGIDFFKIRFFKGSCCWSLVSLCAELMNREEQQNVDQLKRFNEMVKDLAGVGVGNR